MSRRRKKRGGVDAQASRRPEPTLERRRSGYRWPVLAFTIAVVAAGVWLLIRAPQSPLELVLRPKPNVLLISVDTLRADHVGAYGAKVPTPHIDALAREGVLFEKTLTAVPVTLPSHTSLFTGTYPIAHGVRDNGSFRLAEEHETLAESFQKAGYRTAAFIGSFALDSRFGLNQGFDLYDDFYGDSSEHHNFAITERLAEAVLKPAQAWLGERNAEPWFAFIHLWDPHHPYSPPQKFSDLYPEDPYTGEVAYVDEALGHFFRDLEQQGMLDNTLVVFTADHGEGLGQHGERSHGMFAYETTLRVPLILQWKKVLPPGRRIASRVRLIDLAPTLIELSGLERHPQHQGESLVPLIRDPESGENREGYFESLSFNLNRNWAPLTGVYSGKYKYIDLPVRELYDLETDPAETLNLYEHDRQAAERMVAALARVIDTHSTEESRRIETTAVDRDTFEKLRALGYLVDSATSKHPKEYTAEDDPKNLVHLGDMLDAGVAAYVAGRLDESIRLFRAIIAERPTFANAYANLAYVLNESGRLQEAIQVLELALKQGLETRTMPGRLGAYLQEAGRLEESVQVLEAVIAKDPSDIETYNYLSVSYARLGRTRDAIETLHKLLELDPSYASAYSNLGSVYLGAGEMREAETHFRHALDMDPRLAGAWNGLGVVHARSARRDEAISAWKRAIELDSRQYDTLYNLGTLLAQINRLEEAIPYLEQFARTAPPERYGADIPKVQSLIARLRATP